VTGERAGLPPGAYGVAAEVVVPLPRKKAWALFTKGLATWWPAGFATREGATMSFDAKPGGALRESWGRSGGLVWYEVAGIDRGAWILLHGDITAAFGGPARSHVEMRFDDHEGGTRVRLMDTLFAGATPALRGNIDAGWKAILDAYAKGAAGA
jgi:hypothetical protein